MFSSPSFPVFLLLSLLSSFSFSHFFTSPLLFTSYFASCFIHLFLCFPFLSSHLLTSLAFISFFAFFIRLSLPSFFHLLCFLHSYQPSSPFILLNLAAFFHLLCYLHSSQPVFPFIHSLLFLPSFISSAIYSPSLLIFYTLPSLSSPTPLSIFFYLEHNMKYTKNNDHIHMGAELTSCKVNSASLRDVFAQVGMP